MARFTKAQTLARIEFVARLTGERWYQDSNDKEHWPYLVLYADGSGVHFNPTGTETLAHGDHYY
jgi:hypothetical protein